MRPVIEKWICNIDIVAFCNQSCNYCARHMNHIRSDQKGHMALAQIDGALLSLKSWPNAVGISGGEPLLHPEFPAVCEVIRSHFGKHRMFLFTSHRKNLAKYEDDIAKTFGVVHIHEHTVAEKLTNKHQVLTMASGDVVEDKEFLEELINDCWAHKYWAPSINEKGATFCEIAAGISRIFDLGIEWKVEPGWYNNDFTAQRNACCYLCGMPVPMYTQLMINPTERFSRGLYDKMREHGLNVGPNNLDIFEGKLSREAIESVRSSWTPWHYRISDGATKNPCTEK